MIRKLTTGEYAKRYSDMNGQEREDFRKKVGAWLRTDGKMLLAMTDRPMAQTQNVMQMSARWNREQCQSWQKGVWLMTALSDMTDTWLPTVIYTKSAWRAVRKLVSELSQLEVEKTEAKSGEPAAPAAPNAVKKEKPEGGEKEPKAAESRKVQEKPAAQAASPKSVAEKGLPVRPRHIDQYVHLLPQKTQERAAGVKSLLRDLDAARENARLLMNDPHASPQQIANWARTATALDSKVKSIYKELDSEWDRLVRQGVVTVDELGNAHVVKEPEAEAEAAKTEPKKPAGRPRKSDEEKKEERQRKTALLRKWLIDTRNAKTDEQKKKWKAKYRAMVALGGEEAVTDKVREAAKYYGINLKR